MADTSAARRTPHDPASGFAEAPAARLEGQPVAPAAPTHQAPRFDLFSDGNARNEARLKARTRHIVDANRDAIEGRRVLDIAANNGRWSYAAAAAGARSVVSIEGRQERIDDAHRYFDELGVRERIETNQGDMYEFLRTFRDDVRAGKAEAVDSVFCLGIYYHIMDHQGLLRAMTALEPETIIIDSGFVRSFRNSVHVQTEDPRDHLNALAVYPGQKAEPVGFVSLGLMIQMAWNVGYSCTPVLWDPATLENRPCVQDYMMGLRYTLRLDKMSGREDPDWKERWRRPLEALNPRFPALLDPATHDSAVDARVGQPFKSMGFSIM